MTFGLHGKILISLTEDSENISNQQIRILFNKIFIFGLFN